MPEQGEQRRWIAYMPLTEILRAPRNAKLHATELLAGSMTRFGSVESPALDERTGRLVAGHGRLDDWIARRDAGENPPDGVTVDPATGEWLAPIQRGWSSRTDEEAEAYLLISNHLPAVGGNNDVELADMLADLRDQDETLFHLTGYDDTFIAKHAGDTDPWDKALPPGMLDDPPLDVSGYRCPSCRHEWDGNPRPETP